MKFRTAAYAGLLLQASWVHAAEDKPTEGTHFSFDFDETVQYTLKNTVALDDALSPDHLPEDKSHLAYLFYGFSAPVYPSRECSSKPPTRVRARAWLSDLLPAVGDGRSDDSWKSAYV